MSKIMKLKEMLNESIELWGTDDIVTKMLSQRLDKEINKEQIEIYEEYKKGAYAQRKELSKLGYDPREYMIIAAPPHEFTLLHIPSQKIIPKVERMK